MTQDKDFRVLVVDDDQDIGFLFERLLGGPQEVTVAADGYEAVEKMRAQKYDLVFLDVRLPGIDGVETLKQLKEIAPDSVVIMMSGHDVDKEVQKAFALGAQDFLEKPFRDVSEIMTIEQVARYLSRHVGLLVITNNINVVNLLRPAENIELMIAGGSVRRSDGGIVVDQAVDFITHFRVDHAVIGASAIEDDGVLLDFDAREVRVAQAIISNARSVILVADATKFERTAPVRIADVSQIDHFVTDIKPSKRFLDACRAADVTVHTVA